MEAVSYWGYKVLNAILFTIFLLWVYFALFHNELNLELMDYNKGIVVVLIFLLCIILACKLLKKDLISFANVKHLGKGLKKCKWYIFSLMVVFQLVILATCSAWPGFDPGYWLQVASKIPVINISSGAGSNLNAYTNMLPIFAFYKVFNNPFLCQFINLIVIDLSIIYLYYVCKKVVKKSIADMAMLLFMFIIGFTPWLLIPYTDTLSFPLTIAIMHILILLIQRLRIWLILLLGIPIALAYAFKPSLIVFGIATLVFVVVEFLSKKQTKKMIGKSILCVFIGMATVFIGVFSYLFVNDIVLDSVGILNKERQISMKNFLAMGLLDGGWHNTEFRHTSLGFETKSERNAYENYIIRKKLGEYGFIGLVQHQLYKFDIGVRNGTFSWQTSEGEFLVYERESFGRQGEPMTQDEIRKYYMPKWLKSVYDSKTAKEIRKFVWLDTNKKFVDSSKYEYYYHIYGQFVWVVIVFGLLLSSICYKKKDKNTTFLELDMATKYLDIVIFGAILFLSIFEWGRTRYLIQFLPAIVPLSAIGYYKCNDFFKNLLIAEKKWLNTY